MADSRGLAGTTWVTNATFLRILGLFWQRSWRGHEPDWPSLGPFPTLPPLVGRQEGRRLTSIWPGRIEPNPTAGGYIADSAGA